MKRVASLYLPSWSIDRLRRIERRRARSAKADGRAAFDALGARAATERALQCSVPKEGGWRPGARWARGDPDRGGNGLAETRRAVEAAIGALPAHRRPPQRELGRTSEAADNPFRSGEEQVVRPAPLREMARRTEAAEPLFRPGTRGWGGEDLQTAVAGLPAHQRPSLQQLSRKTEVVDNPFRPAPADEVGSPRHAPARPRSARDGQGGEAGYVAPPNLAQSLKQLAAMPPVQFPGEGPHPDNHGKNAPTGPSYGQGRFFQTGRTLARVVARVCQDEEAGEEAAAGDEPPLVIARKTGSRVEVAHANGAAQALGLGPGTALTLARAQVPGLEVREADSDGDAADLAALAELLARRWAPTVAISDPDGLFVDLTGVAHLHGGRADPLGAEALAPALADEAANDLAPLIDALANRIGSGRLWRAVPVESDVPERCWARAAPLGPPADRMTALRTDDVRRLDARSPDHPWHPRWPRPVWLLHRPERIDHVLAELPDQPPRRFTWRGVAYRVAAAEGPERITGEWWRRSAERDAVRDYFRVEDEAGQRFWLFRRGDGVREATGDLSWFIHGLGA